MRKSEIVAKIKEVIENVTLGNVNANTMSSSDELIDDCGLDSLDYAVVMLQVELWTGTKIIEDRVQWSKVKTIEQLADLFKRHETF